MTILVTMPQCRNCERTIVWQSCSWSCPLQASDVHEPMVIVDQAKLALPWSKDQRIIKVLESRIYLQLCKTFGVSRTTRGDTDAVYPTPAAACFCRSPSSKAGHTESESKPKTYACYWTVLVASTGSHSGVMVLVVLSPMHQLQTVVAWCTRPGMWLTTKLWLKVTLK